MSDYSWYEILHFYLMNRQHLLRGILRSVLLRSHWDGRGMSPLPIRGWLVLTPDIGGKRGRHKLCVVAGCCGGLVKSQKELPTVKSPFCPHREVICVRSSRTA